MTLEAMEVTAFDKPFSRPVFVGELPAHKTITDILTISGIPKDQWLSLRVLLSKGGEQSEVSIGLWAQTRPKAGVHVEIFPNVQGAVVGAVLSAVVASAAPSIATFLFGSALSQTALAIITAGITVLGQLVVSALFPPAVIESNTDEAQYTISSTRNSFTRFAHYPKPTGRRRLAPLAAATGYTQVEDGDTYFYGLYTFGHGPIALEDLRIGSSEALDFDDITFEFSNVDRAFTTANIPTLGIDGRSIVSATGENGSVVITGDTTMVYTTNSEQGGTFDVTYVLSGSTDEFTTTVTVDPPRLSNGSLHNDNRPREYVYISSVEIELDPPQFEVLGWRSGEEPLELYSNDIFQESMSRELSFGTPITIRTQERAASASVDFNFSGLGARDDKNRRVTVSVPIRLEYRKVGATAWTDEGIVSFADNSLELVLRSRDVTFPEVAQYDIRLTRTQEESGNSDRRETPVISALRSIQDGVVPSHNNIAKMAVRIRATGQLNGSLDDINATYLQLLRSWDGTEWSELAPLRHPAWVLYDLVTGPSLKEPMDPDDVDVDSLKAWADATPWATCDYTFSGSEPLEEAIKLVCATGFAYPAMNDLKFGVIFEGGDKPRVQSFGPSNAYDFQFDVVFPAEIHAFRMQAASEALNWETDELIVYADGYGPEDDPDNNVVAATLFEEFPLSGVVIGSNEATQGNVWRHGRYNLAAAKLRPITMTFRSGLDQLRSQRGDVVGITYDAAALGVGDGRITTILDDGGQITGLVLDDDPTFGAGTFRLRLRKYDGSDTSVQATCTGQGVWELSVSLPVGEHSVGDLVFVEETTSETSDFQLTNAEPEFDEEAVLTAVPAARNILDGLTGAIPDYVPNISSAIIPSDFGPYVPTITSIIGDSSTLIRERDGSVQPAIRVDFALTDSRQTQPVEVELRYRASGSKEAHATSGRVPVANLSVSTGGLEPDLDYELVFFAYDASGKAAVKPLPGVAPEAVGVPSIPEGWSGTSNATSVTLSGPAPTDLDVSHLTCYGRESSGTDWVKLATFSGADTFTYEPSGSENFSEYAVSAVNYDGLESDRSATIEIAPTGVQTTNLSPEVDGRIVAASDMASDAIQDAATLQNDLINEATALRAEALGATDDVYDHIAETRAELTSNFSAGQGLLSTEFLTPFGGTDTWNRYFELGEGFEITDNKLYPGSGGYTWRFNSFDDSSGHVAFEIFSKSGNQTSDVSLWTGSEDVRGFVVEVEATLLSGGLGGAGFWHQYRNAANTAHVTTSRIPLSDMVSRVPEAGDTFTASAVFVVPEDVVEAGVSWHRFLCHIHHDTYYGAPEAKAVEYHRIKIREATAAEIATSVVDLSEVSARLSSHAAALEQTITATAANAAIAASAAGITTAYQGEISGAKAVADQTYATKSEQNQALASSEDRLLASLAEGLDADAAVLGEIGASVVAQGEAIVRVGNDLQTYQAASFTRAVSAGGSLASLNLFAVDDETGEFSTGLLLADLIKLKGDVEVSGAITVGSGTNLLENSDFAQGVGGWNMESSLNTTTLDTRNAGQSWAGRTYPTLRMYQVGTDTDGNSEVRARSWNVATGEYDDRMAPVIPGDHYMFSVKLSTLRCAGSIYIFWLDQNGNFLSSTAASVSSQSASSTNPETWPEYSVKGQAPSAAFYAQVVIRKYGTLSSTTSWMFIHHPQFERTTSTATGPTPWSNGAVVRIDGGNIDVATINAQELVVGKTLVSANYVPNIAGSMINMATGMVDFRGGTIGANLIQGGVVRRSYQSQQPSNDTIPNTTTDYRAELEMDVDFLEAVGTGSAAKNGVVLGVSCLIAPTSGSGEKRVGCMFNTRGWNPDTEAWENLSASEASVLVCSHKVEAGSTKLPASGRIVIDPDLVKDYTRISVGYRRETETGVLDSVTTQVSDVVVTLDQITDTEDPAFAPGPIYPPLASSG